MVDFERPFKRVFTFLKKNGWLAPFFVQLLIIFVAVVNVPPQGYFFSGGDRTQPFDLLQTAKEFLFVWEPRRTGLFLLRFGYGLYYWLAGGLAGFLRLSITSQSLVHYFLFLSISFWSFYISLSFYRRRFSDLNSWYKAAFSFAYSFNLVTFQNFYGTTGYSPFLFLYGLLPILFGTTYRFFSDSKESCAENLSLLGIIFFFLNISNGNFPFLVSLVILMAVFVIAFTWLESLSFISFLKKGVLYVLVFIAATCWSVFPQLMQLVKVGSELRLGKTPFDIREWILWQASSFPSPLFLTRDIFEFVNGYSFLALFSIVFFFFAVFSFLFRKKKDLLSISFLFVFVLDVFLMNKGKGLLGDSMIIAIFDNFLLASLRSVEKTLVYLPFFLLMIAVLNFNLKKRISNVFLVIFLLGTTISVFPFFTGTMQKKYSSLHKKGEDYLNAEYSGLHKMPEEYIDSFQGIRADPKLFRLLSLPYSVINSPGWVNYPQWNVVGVDPVRRVVDKPIVQMNAWDFLGGWNYGKFWNGSSNNLSTWILPFSGFLNSRHLIFHKDVAPRFVAKTESKMNYYKSNKLVNTKEENDYFNLYEVPGAFYLPRIYVSNNLRSFDGNVENFPYFLDLSEGREPTGWVSGKKSYHLAEDFPVTVYLGSDSFQSLEDLEWNEGWAWPEVSVSPFDWKYYLVGWKERVAELRSGDTLEKTDLFLWHAVKRIAEMETFLEGEVDKKSELLAKYSNKIQKVVDLLRGVPEEDRDEDFRGIARKVAAYIQKTEVVLEQESVSSEELAGISKMHNDFIAWYESAADLWCAEDRYCYEIDISQAGEYEVYVAGDKEATSFGRLQQVGVSDSLLLPTQETNEGGYWLDYGNYALGSGESRFVLELPQSPNLVSSDKWQPLADLQGLSPGINVGEVPFLDEVQESSIRVQEVQSWQRDREYKISFEYKVNSGKVGIALVENQEWEEEDIEPLFNNLFEAAEKNDYWRVFEENFSSGSFAEGARLFVYTTSSSGDPVQFDLRDLAVRKLYKPKLLLEKQSEPSSVKKPRIEFTQVNPTKYKIKVNGATGDYPLVLSESYHEGWKMYASGAGGKEIENNKYEIGNSEEDKGYGIGNNITRTFWRVLGRGLSWVTDLFLDNGGYGEEVASYFDGEIKEGTHRNTFLEPATFETWGKKPIDAEHMKANAYANAWYIEPEDVGGEEDYELIVEFFPQRLFYLGLLISSLTLVGCVSYLGYALVTNANKRE